MTEEYTISEKEELLKDDFMSDETQEEFRKYGKYVNEILMKSYEKCPPDCINFESGANFGFNACLTMIKEATNIDWKEVKWKNKYSSMVTWYSQTLKIARYESK